MTRTYRTTAIIIKKSDFAEADRIFTLFSKHYGKIRALAKGVRRPTSKKGGNLSLFNLVSLFLAEGKNLDIITEVELIAYFEGLRKDLRHLGSAFYLCELVEELTRERQINDSIYYLLKESLEYLNQSDTLGKDFFATFQKRLLNETGFGVPKSLINPNEIENYIESIINKELKSRRIWKRL